MTGDVIPREQAFAAARRVLDQALDRIARDRAAGRLSPEAELIVRRAERRYAERHGITTARAA
ncbi:hypothetical protein [Streptomyces sp. SID2888]|uniref:hypothetical protein n=1 Tax=Streptomyces sp. SID2888 TaxID=2690256 RepID=UPI00136DC6CD|nr:hypothetical protein [Streptomyces sp. SID2888]MYV44965.1 hypothetical protein [Streptomyces sp. SID2888]